MRRVRDAVHRELDLADSDFLGFSPRLGDYVLHGDDGAQDVRASGEGDQTCLGGDQRQKARDVQPYGVRVVRGLGELDSMPELDSEVLSCGQLLPRANVRFREDSEKERSRRKCLTFMFVRHDQLFAWLKVGLHRAGQALERQSRARKERDLIASGRVDK